MPPPACAGA